MVTSLSEGGKQKRMSLEERSSNDSDTEDSTTTAILNWSVRYVVDTGKLGGSSAMDHQEKKKLSNYVELTKDAVEAVVAVSKVGCQLSTNLNRKISFVYFSTQNCSTLLFCLVSL